MTLNRYNVDCYTYSYDTDLQPIEESHIWAATKFGGAFSIARGSNRREQDSSLDVILIRGIHFTS